VAVKCDRYRQVPDCQLSDRRKAYRPAHPQCNPLAVRYPSRIPAYHKSGVGDQQQLRGRSPSQ